MQDAVAEVLAQREAGGAKSLRSTLLVSLLLHAALFGALIAGAKRTDAPDRVMQLNIRFAAPGPPAAISRPGPATKTPLTEAKTEPAKPVETPKPAPPNAAGGKPVRKEAYAPKQESLFGRSTKPVPAAEPSTAAAEAPELPAGASVDDGFALPGVGAAGVTGLEGGDFPYTIYVNQMLSKIGRNWARPQISGEMLAQVYFVIERDGRARDAKIMRSSGNAAFDRAALRSILESSPLPPLPFGYGGTWLGVHLSFH